MVDIQKYSNKDLNTWNRFIENAKNGTFLFNRYYMDYHANRFADHSLMFFLDSELYAVLPANQEGDSLISHGGLTYGGLILSNEAKASSVLLCLEELKKYLLKNAFKRFRYKAVPYIYHRTPAAEDLYALFRYSMPLIRRDISSVIDLETKLAFSSRRERGVKKAIKNSIICSEISDLNSFYDILEYTLMERHGVKPVHTLQELESLKQSFPENIRLFVAKKADLTLAGVLIYETHKVAHAQYIVNSPDGKEQGALDLLFSFLINQVFKDKAYFDFGISTENQGLFLNEGLINQKEEFGARAVVYDTYEFNLENQLST